jgi:hypothetical protein
MRLHCVANDRKVSDAIQLALFRCRELSDRSPCFSSLPYIDLLAVPAEDQVTAALPAAAPLAGRSERQRFLAARVGLSWQ